MSSGQLGSFILENFGWIAAISVLLILACGILLLSINVSRSLGRDGQRSAKGEDLQSLEGTLKRLIETSQPTRASSENDADEDESEATERVSSKKSKKKAAADGDHSDLEKELKKRDSEIRKLKEALKEASEGAVDEETLTIAEERIKELESRLAEYEIIEDDIADLSLFKEENAQLRAELDALRAAQGLPPMGDAPTAKASSERAASTAEPGDSNEPTSEPSLDMAGITGSSSAEPGTLDEMEEDIMAEFAEAVQQQKAADVERGTETFSESGEATEEPDEGDGLNADALMAEAAELAHLNDTAEAVDEPVLDVGLDTDKLAAEAEELPDEKRTGSD